MHVPLGRAGVLVLLKGVGVLHLQRMQHARLAENLHRLLIYIIKGTHVVQASGVVLVVVRKQNRVQVADVVGEHLGAEVRAGIDQDP